MDPDVPSIEQDSIRRRRRQLFRHARVPVRMLVPNFFTLLGLWSLLRAGALDRPELVGSAGWWTLVAAAFASNLLLAQRQWMT